MFGWVFDVPLWIVGPGLVVLLGGFSLVGLSFVRSRILPRMRVTGEDSHFVGTMMHSIMVFYGLVLALIAVRVFEVYSESSRIVSSEATAIAMLYRDTGSYPEPVHSELQTALRSYAENVIHEAWPLQRKGHVPGGATFVASVIFVVLAMDHPFRGDLGITAEPYQLIYDHLMTH